MSNTLKSIPLSKLRASRLNVRKTDRLANIEELAASIEANGLLENLVVQRDPAHANGQACFEVVAGGRRLAALKLLAKRRKIDRDLRIPCLILKEGALQASLAENVMRLPLHPADQFEAFSSLVKDEGLSTDEIGARFGVTPIFVEQRLKLASLSPRLIGEYRAGAMTLEQLTAFTLCTDHKTQEGVWYESPYADIPASMIRRLLTKSQVEGQDRRARFVGAADYQKAGGTIIRDLFDSEDEGYFSDSQLLDRLVGEKLAAVAAEVGLEGWSWVEVHVDTDYAVLSAFGQAETSEVPLGRTEERTLARLSRRYDQLVAELEDEENEDRVKELDAVSAELAALQAKKVIWPEEAKTTAGAIVSLGQDAQVEITRGLIRKGDALSTEETRRVKRSQENGGRYSDAIVLELSSQRTAALREVVAGNTEVAIKALLHALVGQLLYREPIGRCLQISASEVLLERASANIGEGKAGQAFAKRHRAWLERLPEREELWSWIGTLTRSERDRLMAHCVALTLNALEGQSSSPGRAEGAAQLVAALELDMRRWWQPTAAGFFLRLTKDEILAAVTEGVSAQAAAQLVSFKKDEMAAKAEALLAGTTWLPSPWRPAAIEQAAQ